MELANFWVEGFPLFFLKSFDDAGTFNKLGEKL